MKPVILFIAIFFLSLKSFSQYKEVETTEYKEEESERGFKKENLFTGGGIQLSFSNVNFVIGGSPVFGYSINKWFDVGIGFNYTYISAREAFVDNFGNIYTTGNKIRQNDFAPVVFARAYPVKFLFVQAQGEQNFISQKYIYNTGQPEDKVKYSVTSLLLGAGYCSGRQDVGDFFYYISLSFDVLKDRRSPYVQQVENGDVRILPILRAGIQVPLFQGKK